MGSALTLCRFVFAKTVKPSILTKPLKNAITRIVGVEMAKKNKPGAHQTIHPTLKRQIDEIVRIEGVDRVVVGPSKGVRHNRPVGSMKLQSDTHSGIAMIGYSDRGISQFYVITSDIPTVRNTLTEKFSIE
jgi:hypothetical protein